MASPVSSNSSTSYLAGPLQYPEHASISEVLLGSPFGHVPDKKPAILDGRTGSVVFTYASLRLSVRRFASHLVSRLQKFFPVVIHGVLAAGGVVAAFNPYHQSEELAHVLSLSKPKHILVGASLLEGLGDALRRVPGTLTQPTIHAWGLSGPAPRNVRVLDVEDVLSDGTADFVPRKMAPGEAASTTAFISFSSGTSGLVKGVKLSHSNVVANVFQMKQRLPEMYGNDTVSALVVPFFHILGLSGFCCQYLTMGVPIVVFERFEMEALLQSIKRDRITHLNIVPPLALQFLSDPLARKGDYSSIKALINAAAPLKQEIADKLSELMGCAVTQWYGMTEASPAVACQREGEVNVQNTVGKLHYGMALRIVDEEGNDCAEGEPGEFWITGPNIMQGYTTSEHRDVNGAFVNGYLKTGDIGYRDRAGFLYLLDRAKEMIKVKGNQVAPAELEAIILTHTAVSDAAVCGLEVVAEGTEYPVAYITTGVVGAKAQQDLIADVRKYVDSRVAGYKRLRGGVYIVSQIPRNPAGKILRRLLPANAAKTTAKAVKTGGSASKL